MTRIAFFIDGFNLYHAIDADSRLHRYKWLDLHKLCQTFITSQDKITEIYYFTSLATWNPGKMVRHKNYIRALELEHVKVVYGQFKNRDRRCPRCRSAYSSFEEKQTDVNIAITLFKSAILDLYDTGIVISGDSDLVPSIQAVRETFPNKRLGVIIPIGRQAEQLKSVTDFHAKIKTKHLVSCQFPDEIKHDGRLLFRPEEWKKD